MVTVEMKSLGDPPGSLASLAGPIYPEDVDGLLDGIADAAVVVGGRLYVDMSGVTLCGSDGIRLLLELKARVEAMGGFLRIVDPHPHVRSVLEKARLVEVLAVFDSLDEAARA